MADSACEDCGWVWPYASQPGPNSECDCCGGPLHDVTPVPLVLSGSDQDPPLRIDKLSRHDREAAAQATELARHLNAVELPDIDGGSDEDLSDRLRAGVVMRPMEGCIVDVDEFATNALLREAADRIDYLHELLRPLTDEERRDAVAQLRRHKVASTGAADRETAGGNSTTDTNTRGGSVDDLSTVIARVNEGYRLLAEARRELGVKPGESLLDG